MLGKKSPFSNNPSKLEEYNDPLARDSRFAPPRGSGTSSVILEELSAKNSHTPIHDQGKAPLGGSRGGRLEKPTTGRIG